MELIPETIAKIMWKGRPSWLYSDGTILPVISGGDGSGEGAGTEDNAGEGGTGTGTTGEEPKFTQADLNRLLAREKSDGKRVAQAEFLQALGVTDLDEAKSVLQAAKDAEQQQLTEAQRAKREADAEKNKATQAQAEAATLRQAAMVERALIRAGIGIDDKDGDEQLELVSRMVVVEPDADQDAVNAAVADLKKKMPQLFSPEKKPEPKVPGGDPGRQPRGAGSTASPADQARSVLAARHPNKVKTGT